VGKAAVLWRVRSADIYVEQGVGVMTERPYYVFESGEGKRHEARGSVMLFKATAATTNGRFSLMERTLPPGGRMPPAHTHAGVEEAYFVLEGQVTFVLKGLEQTCGPETFVLVPAGTGHTFGNVSATPVRLLVMHSPPLDAYFAELEALWSGSEAPSIDDERALMDRHGMQPWPASTPPA
jgi:mannose-6-phosphate isomerase-like protein (cupin superfamily)